MINRLSMFAASLLVFCVFAQAQSAGALAGMRRGGYTGALPPAFDETIPMTPAVKHPPAQAKIYGLTA